MLIYRLDVSDPPVELPISEGTYVIVGGLRGILAHYSTWARNWGVREAIKTSLKVCSRRRLFFGVLKEDRIIQSGWANTGFCRHYDVEPDSVVLGTGWTTPELRGRGLTSVALRRTIAFLYARGYRRFYADTTQANIAAQRAIAKAGFVERIA